MNVRSFVFHLSWLLTNIISLIKEIHEEYSIRDVHGYCQIEDIPVECANLPEQCGSKRNTIYKYPNKHLRQLQSCNKFC